MNKLSRNSPFDVLDSDSNVTDVHGDVMTYLSSARKTTGPHVKQPLEPFLVLNG